MLTKKLMIAALTAISVAVPSKANVETLTKLMIDNGLDPETGLNAAEGSDEEDSDVADAAQAEGDKAANAAETTDPKPVVREMSEGPVPAPKSLKIEKDRPVSNGIRRPSIGGLCRAIWDALDKIYDAGQPLPTAKTLAKQYNWNLSTCGRQSSEWRKFRGIASKRADVTVE
jgi:hypothetical protein